MNTSNVTRQKGFFSVAIAIVVLATFGVVTAGLEMSVGDQSDGIVVADPSSAWVSLSDAPVE